MGDLRNVLNGLSNSSDASEESNVTEVINHAKSTTEIENEYQYGEHVACVWLDDVGDKTNWHLGVVDKFENGELFVSYMKKTDQKGLKWLFPEEAEIHQTKIEQVIARNIQVKYSLTAMMKCILDLNTHKDIDQQYTKFINFT